MLNIPFWAQPLYILDHLLAVLVIDASRRCLLESTPALDDLPRHTGPHSTRPAKIRTAPPVTRPSRRVQHRAGRSTAPASGSTTILREYLSWSLTTAVPFKRLRWPSKVSPVPSILEQVGVLKLRPSRSPFSHCRELVSMTYSSNTICALSVTGCTNTATRSAQGNNATRRTRPAAPSAVQALGAHVSATMVIPIQWRRGRLRGSSGTDALRPRRGHHLAHVAGLGLEAKTFAARFAPASVPEPTIVDESFMLKEPIDKTRGRSSRPYRPEGDPDQLGQRRRRASLVALPSGGLHHRLDAGRTGRWRRSS